jgi:RND family efflux transporter MFP subunit
VTSRDFLVVGSIVVAAGSASCRQRVEVPEVEPPTLNVTHWTQTSELFMEYPPLVAGRPALLAVHLTRLDDFKALDDGHARLEFTPEHGGAPSVLLGSAPTRPGIFRVEGPLPAPGRYRWALVVEAPGLSDRHELGDVTVYADEPAANREAAWSGAADGSAISYLKEQQWTSEFATELVQERDVRLAVRVPATIEPLTGGEAMVSTPAAGRFVADTLLAVGTTVRSGQAMGRLEPRLSRGGDRATLAAEVAEAQAASDSARAEQSRAERLLADRAIPARRLEDAQRALAVADARLRAAEARLAQRDETLGAGGGVAAGNAFTLRAPIAGRVAHVFATLGASYEEGAPLFRIVRTDRVELRVLVPPADVESARNATAIALEVSGRVDPIPLRFAHMHDAGVIDPGTRALPLQFEVANQSGQLLVGQTGTAVLYQRALARVAAVPRSAVLMEAGRPYVFIQVGGERFVRRSIEISAREGEWIGVGSGLTPGDRVVARGAYDIQLASAARGLPAEGHVH